MKVIKQNGSKELFDIKKVKKSIQKAILDAELPRDAGETLMEQISRKILSWSKNQTLIATSEIRKLVIEELDKRDKSVADSWRKFDEKFKCW